MPRPDLFTPHPRRYLRRLISGGQTGADRAALDAAIALGIPHGGWAPRGRWAEDGPLARRYHLQETKSALVAVRTEWNVRDADATVIFSHGKLTGGSALTRRLARKHRKPVLHVNLAKQSAARALERLHAWLGEVQPRVLNIAGPRASKDPRLYGRVYELLTRLLRE
jgi:putative molybdenum carrier protein